MNPETFFDNFGLLADTPNGVQKLRELILQLAVQGKLVPQDPNDETVLMQFEKIKEEKSRLMKKSKSNPNHFSEGELLTELPNNWLCCKFGDFIELINGRAYKRSELLTEGTPVIRIQNLNGGNSWYYSNINLPPHKYCIDGDLLFAWSATFGPYIWHGQKAIFHYHIWKIQLTPVIDKKFAYYLLKNLTEHIKTKSHGLAMLHMTKTKMEKLNISLPPLNEQKRIVAKVDQLMSLCDELEARQHLNSAALDRLLTAHEPDEFAHHWQRICDNFDLLYGAPENVGELRKAILQLAVQGKLVRQDANDEPAAVLLERIKAEKERLVKEGEIRKGNPLTPIKEEEIPYKLPKEWQWVRLEDLVSLLGDGLHGTPKYSDRGDYFFINGNNLSDGKILIKNNTKRASIDEYNRYKKKLDERTVLVSINGTLGNVAFYDNEKIILGKSACYFNLLHNINKFYLKLLINTSYFLEYAFKNATGSTIKNVSLKSMRLFLAPLPPLAEQRRIVAKVDQLMALCDELEAKLKQSQTDGEKLMEAVVHQLVAT